MIWLFLLCVCEKPSPDTVDGVQARTRVAARIVNAGRASKAMWFGAAREDQTISVTTTVRMTEETGLLIELRLTEFE